MKLLKLLNHELTETQINELKNNWNVTEIVTLSNENIKRFGQVTKENYKETIELINKEINEIKPDIIVHSGTGWCRS